MYAARLLYQSPVDIEIDFDHHHRHRRVQDSITSPALRSLHSDPADWRAKSFHSSPKTLLLSPPKECITLTSSRGLGVLRNHETGRTGPEFAKTPPHNCRKSGTQRLCYRPTPVPRSRVRIGARLRRAART